MVLLAVPLRAIVEEIVELEKLKSNAGKYNDIINNCGCNVKHTSLHTEDASSNFVFRSSSVASLRGKYKLHFKIFPLVWHNPSIFSTLAYSWTVLQGHAGALHCCRGVKAGFHPREVASALAKKCFVNLIFTRSSICVATFN